MGPFPCFYFEWISLLFLNDMVVFLHSIMKSLFNNHIKILQFDNALEYTQSVMHSFCTDHGIIHQTSCPHTS